MVKQLKSTNLLFLTVYNTDYRSSIGNSPSVVLDFEFLASVYIVVKIIIQNGSNIKAVLTILCHQGLFMVF